MSKPIIQCPKCSNPLRFRQWSNRNGEALAFCDACREKWQVRMWRGRQQSEPYQVSEPAQKTKRGSWRLSPEREAVIVAMFGSVQRFLDSQPLVCMSLQDIK